MNINRNNYEEYFLLYTDNELSVPERDAVNLFVQQNPDLQQELQMLQETVLKTDTATFSFKDGLLKNVPVDKDFQEKLLLLLDGELDQNEVSHISTLIEDNEGIKNEWILLQQTKLSAGNEIIFENKAILYRREKEKVIAVKWWRLAAAAVLIGFGLWGSLSYYQRSSGKEEAGVVKNALKNQPVKRLEQPAAEQLTTGDSTVVSQQITAVNKAGKIDNKGLPVSAHNPLLPGKKQVKEDAIAIEDAALKNKKPSNNLPVPSSDNFNIQERNNIEVVSVEPLKKDGYKTIDNSAGNDVKNSLAINTSFSDNKDDNKITYGFEEDEQPKKTKIGGFFKKLNRVLQRKTNIKTGSGDSFKVANLSFAIQ